MLSEKLGHIFDRPLSGLAKKIPLSPNTLSISGFLVTIAASYVLRSSLFVGGLLILAGAAFDILDGVVARTNRKATRFGAFLDSVLDRYSDAFILLGIALNLGATQNHTGVYLCIGTMVGAFLISYARARAEGIGAGCKYGLMERPERIILISLGAISGYIIPTLWIMLVLTHVTVIQRIHHVWKLTGEERAG